MNGPSVVRAIATSTDSLRAGMARALAGVTMLTRENIRLRAELADRDEKIATLQEMLHRSVSP